MDNLNRGYKRHPPGSFDVSELDAGPAAKKQNAGSYVLHPVSSVTGKFDLSASPSHTPENESEDEHIEDSLQIPFADSPKNVQDTSATTDLELSSGLTRAFSINEHDTCFGMIRLVTPKLDMSSIDSGYTRIELSLQFHLGRILIYNAESLTYLGLLDRRHSEALIALSGRFGVVFDPYLLLNSKAHGFLPTYDLCIALQGSQTDSDQIGSLLSEAEIYLQHPRAFYKPVEYHNPQYLSRPAGLGGGQKMLEKEIEDDHFLSRVIITDGDPLNLSIHDAIDSADGPQEYSVAVASPRLRTALKSHQLKALSMMVEKERGRFEGNDFDSMWVYDYDFQGRKRFRNTVTGYSQIQSPSPCYGGILADEMGLGKTLSTLAIITLSLDGMETGNQSPSQSKSTLIVTPMSLLQTWEEQIEKHVQHGGISSYKYHGSSKDIALSELQNYDVVLTTYDSIVSIVRKQHLEEDSLSLLDVKWHRVVLDEAHLIRNSKSKRHQAVCELRALHRWCLTGTPIFNYVEDFWALLAFLRVEPFHDRKLFNTFISEQLLNNPNKALLTFRKLIQTISLRRKKAAVSDDLGLPIREDRVDKVEFDEDERQEYTLLKKSWEKIVVKQPGLMSSNASTQCIFQIIFRLRQFCCHRFGLIPNSLRDMILESTSEHAALDEFLIVSETCSICRVKFSSSKDRSSETASLGCGHLVCSLCKDKAGGDFSPESENCQLCFGTLPLKTDQDASDANSVDEFFESRACDDSPAKISALMKNLQLEMHSTSPAVKSVIFSGWKKLLDLVQIALHKSDISFQQIDGSMNDGARRAALQKFRAHEGYCVLLATVGSAGVGLDLTAASRAHMLEPQWSPMAEEQALDRVHRMGQTQKVIVTRYIVKNSIEEYIVAVQERKSKIINQSIEGSDLAEPVALRDRFMKIDEYGSLCVKGSSILISLNEALVNIAKEVDLLEG